MSKKKISKAMTELRRKRLNKKERAKHLRTVRENRAYLTAAEKRELDEMNIRHVIFCRSDSSFDTSIENFSKVGSFDGDSDTPDFGDFSGGGGDFGGSGSSGSWDSSDSSSSSSFDSGSSFDSSSSDSGSGGD